MVETRKQMRIPLTKPYRAIETFRYLMEVSDSGHWTEGPMVERFERKVAEKVGARYAIACPNATIGLEMVLKVESLIYKTVPLPAYTHPATALAAIRAGYDLEFLDIDKYSGLIVKDLVMKHLFGVYLVPVSLFGNSTGVEGVVVEDAACSLGTEGVGKYHTCVFSFHPRKIISTGEGGMITTNDEGLAQELREHKNFGKGGSNFKMSDFTGAIGIAQMEVLDQLIESRRELAERYDEELSDDSGLISFLTSYNKGSNYQSYVIIVDNRDEVIKKMADVGIETQVGSYNLTAIEPFREYTNYKSKFTGAEFADNHYLTLPLYPYMRKEEQDYVVENLTRILIELKEEEEL